MIKNYDVVIIGAGPAGLSAATNLMKSGLNVLLVSENIGGNYSGVGSVLSNSLLYFSKLYYLFQYQTKNFINFESEKELSFNFDFNKAKKYVDSVTNKVVKTFKTEIDSDKIKYISGKACFLDENNIKITSSNKEIIVNAQYFIIATGSSNIDLKLQNTTKLLGVENVCNIEETPTSVAIIGGGFIGWEYATFFRRIGSKVTIVEKNNKILPKFDEQVVKRFEDIQKKNGIEILKEKEVEKIEKIGNKTILFLTGDCKVETEKVFVAIGRKPNLDGLCLEEAKVKITDNIPVLNAHLQTTNKKIFIVGDATGNEMLVNWAYKTSDIVVNRILGHRKRTKLNFIPKVLHVDPEMASVGLTEPEAKKQGYSIASFKYTYTDFEKSLLHEYHKVFLKIIYNKDNNKILGVHIVGNGSEELIGVFSMLIQSSIKIDNISEFISNIPSFSDILNEIGSKLKEKTTS
jgi:dihydrolipoamide dehydrogenase